MGKRQSTKKLIQQRRLCSLFKTNHQQTKLWPSLDICLYF
jgi:hypothetical protein